MSDCRCAVCFSQSPTECFEQQQQQQQNKTDSVDEHEATFLSAVIVVVHTKIFLSEMIRGTLDINENLLDVEVWKSNATL